MSAARADPDLLARITEWVGDGALALADLGYEGEPDIFRIPFKKFADTTLTVDQQAYNTVHGVLRCLGERANALIKTTYKAPRRYRGCPWHLGDIVGAALVLLHHENHRTTSSTSGDHATPRTVTRKGSLPPLLGPRGQLPKHQ